MKKYLIYASFMLLGLLAGLTFQYLTENMTPNNRWVLIFNKTNCEISSASVVFSDRSVSANFKQIKNSIYPYKTEAKVAIPVLASYSQQFQIHLDFKNCASVLSQPHEFSSGTHIEAWYRNGVFTFSAR